MDRQESFLNTAWDGICSLYSLWVFLGIVGVMALVLLGFSFLFVDQGSGSFLIALVDLVIVVSMLSGIGFVLYRCRRQAGG